MNPDALVLVVDDDPSVRKSLSRALRTAGYAVEVFDGARSLLARLPRGLEGDLRRLLPGAPGAPGREGLPSLKGPRLALITRSGGDPFVPPPS